MATFQTEKAHALLELLQWSFAEDYTGTDDSQPDRCNDWISSLTDDEVCDIILTVFHNGI